MLTGKNGLVLGVANERSIAYAIVKKLSESGCNIVASCLNQKAFDSVLPSIRSTSAKLKICNLQNPGELETRWQVVVGHVWVEGLGGLPEPSAGLNSVACLTRRYSVACRCNFLSEAPSSWRKLAVIVAVLSVMLADTRFSRFCEDSHKCRPGSRGLD